MVHDSYAPAHDAPLPEAVAHGEQTHPYHLVNPSPLPILSSFSLLVLVTGGLMFMHNKPGGAIVAFAGLAMILACMYTWWREVVREGVFDQAHTPAVSHGLRMGMGLFIASEVMFFVAFFWAFFDASLFPKMAITEPWAMAVGQWPPANIHPFDAWQLPFLNTLILLLSGTTVTWAHHALIHGKLDEVKTALWITVALGFGFSCLQGFEYAHAKFGFKEGIYPSTFYMATGFHGFHVLVGTIFLAVCLARVYKGNLTPRAHLGFEFAAWYWHFVDVVWLFLFVFVYWWGGK